MSTALVREFLLIVEEPTYGTAVASPVVWPTASPTAYYVPLVDGNNYTGAEEVVQVETPYGGGIDVPGEVAGDHRQLTGRLTTLAYPALAAFLANLALTRSNGSTVPFTNAEPAGDLASVSIWHGFPTRDGTTFRYGHSGMKVASFELSASRQDPRFKISMDFVGSKETPNQLDSSTGPTALAFPIPTEAQLPRGPYLYSHSAGLISLGGTALTRYQSLSLKVTNKPDPHWFEGHWAATLGVYGREATCDVALLLKGTPNLRATYQALTSQGFSFGLNNGTNSLTIGFNGNNHINKLPYDFPLGKEFMQTATFRNKWDATAGADLTVSNT